MLRRTTSFDDHPARPIAHISLERAGGERADLIVTDHRLGQELRLYLRGRLTWTQACRTQGALCREAARVLEGLARRGWVTRASSPSLVTPDVLPSS